MSNDEQDYKQAFGLGNSLNTIKAKAALELALDIRKFEIGLYWQRAAYFWALIAVAFAGYFAILGSDKLPDREYLAFIVSCIGLLFTWAWFLVNRGSKYWQENWENHVDMLEDEAIGPVYKTVFQERPRFWSLTAAYPFSVSRINQLLSLYVSFIFAALVADTLVHHFRLTLRAEWFPTACLTLTAAFLLSFLWRGRIRFEKKILAVQRKTTLAGYNSTP